MASELKPCPFCHKTSHLKIDPFYEPSFDGYYGFNVVCSAAGFDNTDRGCGAAGAWGETEEDAAIRWNTRPAPAATVTGLVTWKFHAPVNGSAKMIQSDNGEWVPRSQAEELLAAKDADIDRVLADNRRCLVRIAELEADNAAKDADIAELVHDLNRTKDHETELVNDNAAKEARIKELEELLAKFADKGTLQALKDANDRAEALEAKLAAAEKALAFYADPSKWNDGYFKSEDDGTVLRAYPSSIENDQGDKARAALGGKPS